jgi:Winged helix DNA-binding domain
VTRTLTTRELNRALLARQLLLERAELSPARALERVGGLQTQYAPSGYVGLWSRLAAFERGDLTTALERRRVIQGTLMRTTIHMVSAGDYWPFALGVRRARRDWWLRATQHREEARGLVAAARRLTAFLAEGPRTRAEIVAQLGFDNATLTGAGLWVDVVRATPSGTWDGRRADRYALAETWVAPPAAVDPHEGIERLVRRYLAAFGPASRKDVASWTGLPLAALAPVLARMRLRAFSDQEGIELIDLPRAPLPDPDTPAPVRFLPTFDSTLLAHARRTQILPERYRPRVFHTKMPQSIPTFLVDGQVAGTWSFQGGRVRIDPFDRIPANARHALAEEADRLAGFMD